MHIQADRGDKHWDALDYFAVSLHKSSGARPTNDISIELKSRPKFGVLWFKMHSNDQNKILHTSRQDSYTVVTCAKFLTNSVSGTGAWAVQGHFSGLWNMAATRTGHVSPNVWRPINKPVYIWYLPNWIYISLGSRLFVQHVGQTNNKATSKFFITGLGEGIRRSPVDSSHKRPVMWIVFPCHDVIIASSCAFTIIITALSGQTLVPIHVNTPISGPYHLNNTLKHDVKSARASMVSSDNTSIGTLPVQCTCVPQIKRSRT